MESGHVNGYFEECVIVSAMQSTHTANGTVWEDELQPDLERVPICRAALQLNSTIVMSYRHICVVLIC